MPIPTTNAGDAVEWLLSRGSLPLLYWLKKDVLDVPVDRETRNLEKFVGRIRICESQAKDGSWPGEFGRWRRVDDKTGRLVETLRNLFRLHDYGSGRAEVPIERGIAFLSSSQTREGDFRAASINEYTPGFHALTLEILCRYGLDADERVAKGFRWILRHRQKDGGWAIPCRTLSRRAAARHFRLDPSGKGKPAQADPAKPSAHFITGLALRALAESPLLRAGPECRTAAGLLAGRFFKEDKYEDRREASHWEELSYPFWSTNILSVLDAVSRMPPDQRPSKIEAALEWLIGRRNDSGCWEAKSGKATLDDHLWVTFAVLRVLKRFNALSL
ncbi:MAG: hypothetical protein FJY82_04415 [Candidatus Aminicenantes bacterium]|nr:hypothetical protein [Candidatus Aminicenantes bacterium]